jgi:hypothetical protein
MKKFLAQYGLISLIVAAAFIVRLYRIHYPLLDWHSFRQADTASVTREYVKNGIDLFRPTYHDISSHQSGLDNPSGYRMVEFPIINGLTALILRTFPALPLVPTIRMLSIIFSMGTLLSIFCLAKSLSGKKVAHLATLTFALLPYSIYYTRTILPEIPLIFFSTFSLAAFVSWLRNNDGRWYILSVLSLALAFLLKPFVGFLAPVYLVLVWQKQGRRALFNIRYYLYVLIAVAPLVAWRYWITQFPEGIPASKWLLNGNGIRLRPAWFRWLGYERLTKLMLGYTGIVFIPAAFDRVAKDTWVYLSWWLGIGLYFIVIATGNVQHDYYQILALPILSITVGKGVLNAYEIVKNNWGKLKDNLKIYGHPLSLVTIACIYAVMLILAWQQVKGFFNVNNWEYVRAGQVVAQRTPEDAKIIAPLMSNTAFLFQTERKGWPIGGDIEEKIEKGATHYVTTIRDKEAQELARKYLILEQTDEYLIIDLTKRREETP